MISSVRVAGLASLGDYSTLLQENANSHDVDVLLKRAGIGTDQRRERLWESTRVDEWDSRGLGWTLIGEALECRAAAPSAGF